MEKYDPEWEHTIFVPESFYKHAIPMELLIIETKL
jgi:hypothetical protein